MHRKNLLSIIFFSLFTSVLSAQEKNNDSLYAKSPLWIQMIDSDSANYYETIKAYEIYEKNNKLPQRGKDLVKELTSEELIQLAETQKNQTEIKKYTPEELAQQQRDQEMIYQMRRYQNWKKVHASHVRGDGSIPTIQEQIDLAKKQQEEQRKLEVR